jgi:hypothetical protein
VLLRSRTPDSAPSAFFDFEALVPQIFQSEFGQVGWIKQLANGSVASAQLSNAVPDQGGPTQRWDLFVGAPPIGTRVSGC